MGRHMINDRVNVRGKAMGVKTRHADADADARQNEFSGGTGLIKSSLKYLFIQDEDKGFLIETSRDSLHSHWHSH